MQYRNVKNGHVIDVSSIITSDVWEMVEKPSPSPASVTNKQEKKVKKNGKFSKRK